MAGLAVSAEVVGGLATYLELLERWNRKINLTALALDPPSEESLDRLLIEPLCAASFIKPEDRVAVDIGSGGGSPAIPIQLARPDLRMVMVESKIRKTAFLHEAVRQLEIETAEVRNCRYEELLTDAQLHETVDVVTMRAIRVETKVLKTVQSLLRLGGRVFVFTSGGSTDQLSERLATLKVTERAVLLSSLGSQLEIITRF